MTVKTPGGGASWERNAKDRDWFGGCGLPRLLTRLIGDGKL